MLATALSYPLPSTGSSPFFPSSLCRTTAGLGTAQDYVPKAYSRTRKSWIQSQGAGRSCPWASQDGLQICVMAPGPSMQPLELRVLSLEMGVHPSPWDLGSLVDTFPGFHLDSLEPPPFHLRLVADRAAQIKTSRITSLLPSPFSHRSPCCPFSSAACAESLGLLYLDLAVWVGRGGCMSSA